MDTQIVSALLEPTMAFLVVSLFFPRLSLLWLALFGGYPEVLAADILDVLGWIFVPRILILVWIATTMGVCAFFWIHLVIMVLVWISSINKANKT